jgi:hypothetical protein
VAANSWSGHCFAVSAKPWGCPCTAFAVYSNELIACLSKADSISRYLVAVDFDAASKVTADDLNDWTGRILILEATMTPSPKFPERQAIKAQHPQAVVHTFHGTGHIASIARVNEICGGIKFLQQRVNRNRITCLRSPTCQRLPASLDPSICSVRLANTAGVGNKSPIKFVVYFSPGWSPYFSASSQRGDPRFLSKLCTEEFLYRKRQNRCYN